MQHTCDFPQGPRTHFVAFRGKSHPSRAHRGCTMDPDSALARLVARFPDAEVVTAMDAHFVFDTAARELAPDRRQPFATLVWTDAHDKASALHRDGVWRLNLGVSRETYRARFGAEPRWEDAGKGYDFTQLDVLLPHPVYSPLSWVCVLSPGDSTWERLLPLLDEAYRVAHERHAKALARGDAAADK